MMTQLTLWQLVTKSPRSLSQLLKLQMSWSLAILFYFIFYSRCLDSGPILTATLKRRGAGQGLLQFPVVSLALTYSSTIFIFLPSFSPTHTIRFGYHTRYDSYYSLEMYFNRQALQLKEYFEFWKYQASSEKHIRSLYRIQFFLQQLLQIHLVIPEADFS